MFSRHKASKKWHRKALMIDPKKTILVLSRARKRCARSERVPPWIRKTQFNQDVRDFFQLLAHDDPRL